MDTPAGINIDTIGRAKAKQIAKAQGKTKAHGAKDSVSQNLKLKNSRVRRKDVHQSTFALLPNEVTR
mgnify:CR=1 FL=1